MQIRWALVVVVWWPTAVALQAQAAEQDTLERVTTPALRIVQHCCGALLRDDFAREWQNYWREVWVQDTALKVYCKDGRLRISGISGKPVPVCADHHEFRFTGLVSRNFVQRDVVLACQMQVLAPLPQRPVRARYLVHLCGAMPDYFVDQGISHEPDDRRGWFFAPIADGYPFSHDHQVPFVSVDELAPDKEHLLVIEHRADNHQTLGWVIDAGVRRPLGEARIFMSATQIELKVDVPYDGVQVDVAYDNVRLYPRPEIALARFVLLKPPFPYFPFPNAVLVVSDTNGKVIARMQTDAFGEAACALPSERVYPIGVTVSVETEGKQMGVATIQASDIDGLYPGDVWVIIAPDEFKVADRGYPMGM